MRPALAIGLALALLVATPLAAAGVRFVADYEDPRADVQAPSIDILRVTSSVDGGIVTQRVEMAQAPDPARDTIILRSWFHDSTNGSFHVVDLETHPAGEWRAILRQGAFENVTPIPDATYAIEGSAYVFTFPEDPVADGTCFDPIVWAQHRQDGGAPLVDVGGVGARACRTRGDPPIAGDGPPGGAAAPFVTGSFPERAPMVDAPGSRAPPLGAGVVLVAAGLVAAGAYLGLRARRGP